MDDTVRTTRWLGLLLLALVLVVAQAVPARAERIQTISRILGAEPLKVEGIGVITGLSGTGDSSGAVTKMMRTYLDANEYNFGAADMKSKNLAIVRIDATIDPFSRPGDTFDLRISSINDASSLANGVLKMCQLRFHTGGPVVAQASGRVVVGNNGTTGRVISGGTLIDGTMLNRSFIDENGTFRLVLKRPSFPNATEMANTINSDRRTNPNIRPQAGFSRQDPPPVAKALDAKMVVVRIPDQWRGREMSYLAAVLRLDVPLEPFAAILIDKQTGTVVVSGEVQVMPGFISHDGRTVTLEGGGGAAEYEQPANGQRAVVDVLGAGKSRGLSGRDSLQSLVDTLSAMQATPADVIVILEKLKAAGLIQAELVVE